MILSGVLLLLFLSKDRRNLAPTLLVLSVSRVVYAIELPLPPCNLQLLLLLRFPPFSRRQRSNGGLGFLVWFVDGTCCSGTLRSEPPVVDVPAPPVCAFLGAQLIGSGLQNEIQEVLLPVRVPMFRLLPCDAA